MDAKRGCDGLTPEDLRTSRDRWWDNAFTRLLREPIPHDARRVVDVGCGLARAAHALLPIRERAHYLGFDLDAERLALARAELAECKYAQRVSLVLAPGERLPLEDGSVDIAMTAMTLQHVFDVPVVLRELLRILRPGGSGVFIEPDNLDQRVYFDEPLEGAASALRCLHARGRALRLPRDIALGPRVASIVSAVGFEDVSSRPHLVVVSARQTAGAFADRLRKMARSVAQFGGLEPDSPELAAALHAIDQFVASGDPERQGFGVTTTTVFRCVGRRSE